MERAGSIGWLEGLRASENDQGSEEVVFPLTDDALEAGGDAAEALSGRVTKGSAPGAAQISEHVDQ